MAGYYDSTALGPFALIRPVCFNFRAPASLRGADRKTEEAMKQTDATNGAGSSAATNRPTSYYPKFDVHGMWTSSLSLSVDCSVHPDPKIGRVIRLHQSEGALRLQFDMKPDHAEALAQALTECAAFMRGRS